MTRPTNIVPSSSHMSWLHHFRATLALGLPLIGAQLAQMAINVTDTVMIGWLGATELAAGVLATQLYYLFWLFGSGFAQAVMPLAADAQGRGDIPSVRRSVRMGLWVILAYSALVMVPMWHTQAILLWLGQEADVSAIAGRYVRILQWSMFPALIIMGLRSYLSVLERTSVVLGVTLINAILNAILVYMLIFGHFGAPRLGVEGAAAASLAVNVAGAALLFCYTRLKKDLGPYELYVRFWRPDWHAFFEIIRLGWPISLTLLAEAGLFAAAAIMMGWLGTIPLAAHGIAVQISAIVFMIPLGLSSAATVRVGLAYGRRDLQGIARAGISALVIAVLVALCSASLFWMIPEKLIGLYLDENNPNATHVLAVGVPLLAVAAAFQIGDGLQAVGSGVLRGLSDTRTPMLIAVFSYWLVGLPVAYVLGFIFHWSGIGVWWGLAFGLVASAFLMNWRFARRERLGLVPRETHADLSAVKA